MKIEAVITEEHSDLETPRLLEVSQSFVIKVRKELVATNGGTIAAAKRKTLAIGPNAIRTPRCLGNIQKCIESQIA